MTISLPDNLNWRLIGADIASALTMVSMIPYDKDTMDIINQVVPPTWIPFIIKAGIMATVILRLWDRYSKSTPSQPAATTPQAGAVQATVTKA